MEPKSTKILWKSVPKLPFDFESFSTPFFRFPLRFSTPETPKIEPKRRTVVRFRTFLIFSLRSLLGSILDHLGLHFGWFWYPFSLHLRIQGPIKKTQFSNRVFLRFWSDFGLHFGPPAFHHSPVLGHLPLSWVISRCLGSPPALRCDFFLSWVRFWTVFGPFPTKSGLDFLLRGPFFYDSGVLRSLICFSFLSSFLLCCRVVVFLFVCLFVCFFSCLFLVRLDSFGHRSDDTKLVWRTVRSD